MTQVLSYPTPSNGRPTAVFSPDEPLSAKTVTRPARILIVEDDYLAATEIETVLREAGFDVVGMAISADESLQLARSENPELIIMDIRLAGRQDGVDAALTIFRETGIRCIFATAHNDRHIRSRAEPAAPLGWLAKPYAPHALIAMVRHALAQL
jgi:DNA-binding NarL/FixJ family response regulator